MTEEAADRRAGQLGPTVWVSFGDSRTSGTYEEFTSFWFPRRGDVEWKGVVAKDGVTLVDGGRLGSMQAMGLRTPHSLLSVLTSGPRGDFPRGAILAEGWGIPSGSVPGGSATWRGLMAGADKQSKELLQGDASITFDFAAMMVDIGVANIVNLDRMAAHAVPTVSFPNMEVSEYGSCVHGCSVAPTCVRGGFGGSGHEEAGAVFYTPDMTGGVIARRQ